MPEPKVSEFVYTSEDGGIFQITVRRRPEHQLGSPMTRPIPPVPGDVPPDIAQAIKVWLAGNQA
jgi:hypothetical protein